MKKMLILSLISGLLINSGAMARSLTEDIRHEFLSKGKHWDTIRSIAVSEGEVNFYHWGGDDRLNVWLDSVVAGSSDHFLRQTGNEHRIYPLSWY